MSQEVKAAVKTIIIDDDPAVKMDLSAILKKNGYSVVAEGSDGFDAIELCRKHRPSLLVMDLKMPLLDGFCASKVISSEKNASTIVLLTGLDGTELGSMAVNAGASGYITKPFEENSVILSIKLAQACNNQVNILKKQLVQLDDRLSSHRTVDRAKYYLVENMDMTEPEAYDYLRNLSLRKKMSMASVAEFVLLKQEFTLDENEQNL